MFYDAIYGLLQNRKLRLGLGQLAVYAEEINNWSIKSEIESLQTTYEYMLQYASQGVTDPARKDLYNKIYNSAFLANEKLHLYESLNSGNSYISDKYRLYKQHPLRSYQELNKIFESYTDDLKSANTNNELADIPTRTAIMKRHQQASDDIFYKTLIPNIWNKEDYSQAMEIISSENVIDNVKALVVTAAGISLLYFADPLKFRFLVNVYRNSNKPVISQRALTGLVLCIYFKDNDIRKFYPDLLEEFKSLDEYKNFSKELSTIQMQLLVASETEEVGKKMRDEIIPSIMNNAHIEKPDNTIREISLEDMIEFNPEWEKSMGKIKEQMKQLYDMKNEGADTYMYAFSSMKIYPFFSEPAHWFYKFGDHVPEVHNFLDGVMKDKTDKMMFVMNSTDMCDSDKFSLCFTFKEMPGVSNEMLSFSKDSSEEKMKEFFDSIQDDKDMTAVESRSFIQDYYRFCKLCSAAKERKDIFKYEFKLWNNKTLSVFLNRNNSLRNIADYLLSKGHYESAGEIYSIIASENPTNAEIFQKIGYIHIKTENYDLALEALNTANILNSEDSWTMRNLALCYRKTGSYNKALDFLYEAERTNPDNLSICLQLGQVLTYLKQYDKALKYLFKVDYLGEGKTSAQRNIAWCYFMTDKYDEALKMYNKIADKKDVKSEDFINMGHIYLVMNNMTECINCYTKASEIGFGKDSLLDVLKNDKNMLIGKGIQDELIDMMPDLIEL